jgi:PAS domain S-box-containing protein
MSEGILVLDRDGRIVLVNKAALRLIGIPEGANADQQAPEVFDVFLPTGEFLPAPQRPIGRALRGEFVQNFELNFLRKSDGETGLREVTTAPVLDANGQFGQVIVTFRDIAERQRMGEARTRLAAIVDSSQDAIIGKDTRGIVTTWNAGAEKIFGYSAREMIGQPIRLLLPPDHEQEEDDILARIENGDTVEHFETLRRKKDGDLIHVSLTISPIKDAHGRIVGASKIARNITETRKLERQLHQSQKMDAIGQLTGGIAHDFNNLLGIILGNLDLLESYAESNEAALDQVRTAQRAATRGADLTRRLLAFARMEGLKPASTLLNSSIESMIGLAKRVLGPEITITTQLDESLPRVFVDAAGLESALLNLVVNARDAMPGGGSIAVSTRLVNLEESYATVRMGELKAGWYACAAVSDTGEGMSKETLDRAFEPFFTTKSRDKGTGLGLAMVYGFAKQSGGAARIYSEPGKGTTVSIYLPLVAAEQEQSAVSQRQSPTTKMAGVVLVVDDEVDLLKIASAYLKEMGLTPLVAIDGASALEIIRREAAIDLMVTDIAMPGGMNGVELAQQTLVINPKIKLIYSSGFPADALAEKRMSLIQGPMLHKPYQRSEFKAMVRSVLEKSATTV